MNKVAVSGVVVSFNEERDIGNCLKSMLKVCDEVIVVDSFSTDRTPEICQQLGVRFIQHAFEGYIEQKRFAATQVTNNIILSLDADEVLSDKLVESIKEVKSNWEFDGYNMNRKTNYCGKWINHSGWYPDRKLRLFDYSKSEWGGSNPHDKVIMKDQGTEGWLDGDILHYSYYTFQEHVEQVNRFSEIAARSLYQQGVRSNYLKLLYKPLARILKTFIIKLGFLDGKEGFIIAGMTGKASFLKYRKLIKLQKENG